MAEISRLKEGQVLYTVSTRKMGNTTISTVAVHSVRVISIDTARNRVKASWNSNAPREYGEHEVKSWRVNKPKLVATGFAGRMRLARRGE